MDDKKESTRMMIALTVKHACIDAAKEGFRDASMSGLCRDGAVEAAIGAIESLDLEETLKQGQKSDR